MVFLLSAGVQGPSAGAWCWLAADDHNAEGFAVIISCGPAGFRDPLFVIDGVDILPAKSDDIRPRIHGIWRLSARPRVNELDCIFASQVGFHFLISFIV